MQTGVQNLPWLFSAVFVSMLVLVPLFGWIAGRLPVRRLIPTIYLFFSSNLFLFFLALISDLPRTTVAPVFFVWVSVFNLFVVSVFWSVMADLYSTESARRLFGFIAAGGNRGAVAGCHDLFLRRFSDALSTGQGRSRHHDPQSRGR